MEPYVDDPLVTGDQPNRGDVLRRSGLVFLGGVSALAASALPADASISAPADHPTHGLAICQNGFTAISVLDATPSPVPLPPIPRPKDRMRAKPITERYAPCRYFGFIMKRYSDPVHGGFPTLADLDALNIPLPNGARMRAAYKIDAAHAPHISGLDERGVYHGADKPYRPDDPNDPGTPIVGEALRTYYDVYLLVFD
jgi:hypothetical protein